MNSEELHEIFFVECEEGLEAAEGALAACQAGTHDDETINAIFRAIHSIKGGAGAFGFAPLQAFTHSFETLLSDVREGKLEVAGPLVSLMLRALDLVSAHVETARGGAEAPDDAAMLEELTDAQAGANNEPAEQVPSAAQTPEGTDDFDLDLDSLLDDLADDLGASEPLQERWLLHIRFHDGAMANGGEPLLQLRELAELGGKAVLCDRSQLPPLDQLDVQQGYLGWTFSMPADVSQDTVREIFDFIEEDCSLAFGEDAAIPDIRARDTSQTRTPGDASIGSGPETASPESPAPEKTAKKAPLAPKPSAPAASSKPVASQSIRIDLHKLDKLIDGVGELVIAQAMLAQRLETKDISMREELASLTTLVRDVQENAMAFRAQPIGAVFGRMPRLLRELASSTGKHVKLEMSGEATELDKSVIERLSEPLTHLIRNAVDHGIEASEARLAAGKPAEGTLRLSAEQRAGRIVIRIEDDGKGIDREQVLAKAIKQGLVSEDARLENEEIDELIFAPGFSTAETVSSISGRGVGMDVVRQNVKELGGRISIRSRPGHGTAFILALPLTLAISDGMVVQVGDQTLVVPLAHVKESLLPSMAELKGMGSSRMMLNVRGNFIPVISLHNALGMPGKQRDPFEGVLVVVDTESQGQAALLVDGIADQRQFVVKSLDKSFARVEGVAGATILGDGKVALILDVDRMVEVTNGVGGLKVAA